jgi:hypothetical protein
VRLVVTDATVVWLAVLALIVCVWWRATAPQKGNPGDRPLGGVGSAAAGTIYDMLNQEKRNAIEVIVEERAGERDPEDRDGNLPDLEKPKLKS